MNEIIRKYEEIMRITEIKKHIIYALVNVFWTQNLKN